MLFVFAVVPHFSHVSSMVGLANGLRAVGHEAVFATAGPAVDLSMRFGVPAVDVVPDWATIDPFSEFYRPLDPDERHGIEELVGETGRVFGRINDLMWDGLADLVARWRPDGVVYSPLLPSAAFIAASHGTPAFLHNYGPPRPAFEPAVTFLATRTDRLVGLPDDVAAAIAIDIHPPSLKVVHPEPVRPETGAARTARMGYRPFSGGGDVYRWMVDRGHVPRIVVTLGSTGAHSEDPDLLDRVVEAAHESAFEVVVCGPEAPRKQGGRVRHVTWAPLQLALHRADGVVHHGGSGTALIAYAVGTPQVIVPSGELGRTTAEIATHRGLADTVEPGGSTVAALAESLRRVVHGVRYREAATEVRDEILSAPGPESVARDLVDTVRGASGGAS